MFLQMMGWVAPGWTLNWMQKRQRLESSQRQLADRGRRLPRRGSANSEAKDRLRARYTAREMVVDRPYAARAVQVIANNVVGHGIKCQIKPVASRAKVKRVQAQCEELEQLWRKWAGSPLCDYEGDLNFYGIQHLVMATLVASGEVLVRRPQAPRLELPL